MMRLCYAWNHALISFDKLNYALMRLWRFKSGSVRSKAVVLLFWTFCLLLLPLWESVIVLCFVVRYFMSILVLQSSWWGRESWLLCLICLPGVSCGWAALPYDATGLSAVCDCGISWSYSFTISDMIIKLCCALLRSVQLCNALENVKIADFMPLLIQSYK